MNTIRIVLLLAILCGSMTVQAYDKKAAAKKFKAQLKEQILPYWYDTALDKTNGGYLLSDNAAQQAAPATVKQLVSQARMVWGFSHAYRKGYTDPKRDYLAAAESGYRFLIDHFRDPKHGGYYWTTDLKGKPISERKILYGESFVIYALVEYYRASDRIAPLRQALELFEVIQQRAHDARNGGWFEHFERDWKPIMEHGPGVEVEVGGLKSANTHLHWMEALAELFDATRDDAAGKALEEAVRINMVYFYPRNAGESCFHRQPDWKPVTDPKSAGLSYGHNVEFAWLMVRADDVLRRKPAWDHFDAHLEHALKYGYDHARGGLYHRGVDNQPATDHDKIWWVQSEMLAALTDGLQHHSRGDYSRALEKLLDFLFKYQINPPNGIWFDTVAEDGARKNPALAHNWKANYHDVRAIVKFVDAYGK